MVSSALKSGILAVLMSMPPYYADPDRDERLPRMEVVAEGIDSATMYATCTGPWEGADWCRVRWPPSQRTELAALEVTLAQFESGLAEHVHAGRCRLELGECDAERRKGVLVATSVTIFQMKWNPVIREEWPLMVGVEQIPTFYAAYAAAKVLGVKRAACAHRSGGNWVYATISGYASGTTCSWAPARRREAVYRTVLAKLRASGED